MGQLVFCELLRRRVSWIENLPRLSLANLHVLLGLDLNSALDLTN
jgi:hypothetical protein